MIRVALVQLMVRRYTGPLKPGSRVIAVLRRLTLEPLEGGGLSRHI